jgi:4-amino-4-deoxy-L-arabinose transferase-like glycosyltransferase
MTSDSPAAGRAEMMQRRFFGQKISSEKFRIAAIFGLGLLLRLFGSLRVNFVFDEDVWVESAKNISLSLGRVRLPLHGAFHPPFEAYLIKLSTVLFARNPLGLVSPHLETLASVRFLHVLLSSATIVILYLLVREGWGRGAATWTALIVTFCQFHIHFSRIVIQTAPLLFFVSLSLLFFWKAVKRGSGGAMIFAGVSLGLAYLCEETASLVLPIYLVFLLVSGRVKPWLKRWESYVAVAAFAVIISPDLAWNLSAQSPDIKFHLMRAASFHGPSLLPASLFIGELFLLFVRDIFGFVGGLGRPPIWTVEYAPLHWVLGVMCLAAVISSIGKWKDDFVKLQLIAFFFVFLFFTVFASKGPLGNFNFWWASLCYLPAVILLGGMFSTISRKPTPLRWLPAAFIF